MTVKIDPATTARAVEDIRALFQEYAESLDFDLCFQGFDDELAALPGDYAAPRGRLLLAKIGGAIAGGVGLRPLTGTIAEMKRLYVRPAYRAHKAGRKLAEAVIAEARAIGYRAMRLDTIDTMTEAIGLYRSLGFREIPAYCDNPVPGVRYYELDLDSQSAPKP